MFTGAPDVNSASLIRVLLSEINRKDAEIDKLKANPGGVLATVLRDAMKDSNTTIEMLVERCPSQLKLQNFVQQHLAPHLAKRMFATFKHSAEEDQEEDQVNAAHTNWDQSCNPNDETTKSHFKTNYPIDRDAQIITKSAK